MAPLTLRRNPGSKMKLLESVIRTIHNLYSIVVNLQDNILFGSPYNEEHYQKFVYQCGLERELELLEAGIKLKLAKKG
jgi:hypothetical protein